MRSTPTRTLINPAHNSARTRARVPAACALAAVALTAAGCTGSSGGSQPKPGTTTAAGSATGSAGAVHQSGGGTYSDSSAVLTALKTAGHACTVASGAATPALSAPGLRSATACSIGSGGGAATATVFDNHTDAKTYAGLLTSSSGLLISSSSTRAVLGQNWVVLVPDDAVYADQISAALGASVLGPGSSG